MHHKSKIIQQIVVEYFDLAFDFSETSDPLLWKSPFSVFRVMRVPSQKFASVFNAFLIIVAIIVVSENNISFNSIMYENNPESKLAMIYEWKKYRF